MFKFNVDPTSLKRCEAAIRKQITTVLSDQKVMQEVGTVTTERIRYQARITQPINMDNAFPALKPSTIRNREYLLKYNQNHPTAEKTRSNITITGNFLDSLAYEYVSPGVLAISFKGNHLQYRGKKGQKLGKVITNEQLLGYLRAAGFNPFAGVALNAFTPLKSRIRSIIKAALRRSL